MLRSEANEPQIDEKINIFRSFWKAESAIRGIDHFDGPPPTSLADDLSHQSEQRAPPHDVSSSSSRKQDLNVHVPEQMPVEDDYDYSPGGRPILRRQATLPPSETPPRQHQVNTSSQSTAILTPTSSIDDDNNKTPVQSPPEEQPQPKYKAYVPTAVTPNEGVASAHRSSISFSNLPAVISPSGLHKGPDEIFFGSHGQAISKSISRPTSSDSTIAIPAPLSFAPNRPALMQVPSKKDPSKTLLSYLPIHLAPTDTSPLIEELRTRFAHVKSDTSKSEELTKSWEKAASLTRRKRDDARRTRQEENEEHNDDLFNSNEISYAEMNELEDEFKQKEGELKANEDREDYKSYVEAVFDPVYEGLQAEIKALMDSYVEAESLLPTSVSGVRSLEGSDAPSTKACLGLLQELHEEIEKRQEKIIESVAERDRRYKKTETQPLYAAGNIARMKTIEKHFEAAEKQAVLRARREKAERVAEFVKLTEEVVINAVSTEQHEIDQIVAAIKDLEDGKGDAELLARAHATLKSLKASSKALLAIFNDLEISLNSSVLEAEMAQVRAESADTGRLQELEQERLAGAKKMTAEYERRITVLDQDNMEIDQLVQKKSSKPERSEEQEKEHRLKAALEEAKRRNGAA